jgi:hypothetical protein
VGNKEIGRIAAAGHELPYAISGTAQLVLALEHGLEIALIL